MSKQFIKAVKATKKLAPHELMALLVLIEGQVSCKKPVEESAEARLDQPLKERDYDLDDQDPSEPSKTKTQLDIELLNYRIRDPRISDEERQQIALEIWNLNN